MSQASHSLGPFIYYVSTCKGGRGVVRKCQILRILRTGKSFSEALIIASVNPQYGKTLFIEFPEKYKFRTCCVQKKSFWFCFDISKQYLYTTCSELVFFGEFNEQFLVILYLG